MGEPYIGEIRMFAGLYAPAGWALCDGQMLAIEENDALFSLIGTTYGGDGERTFGLPNLQGRLPLHQTGAYPLGQMAGEETVTLTTQQMPTHNHGLIATPDFANSSDPTGRVVAKPSKNLYRPAGSVGPMAAQSIALQGQGLPHSNMQPYLCVNFIISLYGVFPNQT
jgi:microcystin-dependent protein